MRYEWLALIAAALWALTSLISVTPARHLGAFAYSRWRMGMVTLMLGSASLITGGWRTLNLDATSIMFLSGIVGIFLGDTALFACMNRLGPRRAGLLFACHAAFSALIGVWLFGESLQGWQLIGAITLFFGVSMAILFGKRGEAHDWETIHGSLGIAILLGLFAALCQSLGAVMAKPLMASDIDPLSASMVRMAAAFSAHLLLYLFGGKYVRARQGMTYKIFAMIAANGFLAMAVGMTLILYALRYGDVGMVALLSSTSPIFVLPLLWLYTKRSPAVSAWLASLIAVAGTLMLIR
jgi:drug/metabolite transporter (DMT)-like permease